LIKQPPLHRFDWWGASAYPHPPPANLSSISYKLTLQVPILLHVATNKPKNIKNAKNHTNLHKKSIKSGPEWVRPLYTGPVQLRTGP